MSASNNAYAWPTDTYRDVIRSILSENPNLVAAKAAFLRRMNSKDGKRLHNDAFADLFDAKAPRLMPAPDRAERAAEAKAARETLFKAGKEKLDARVKAERDHAVLSFMLPGINKTLIGCLGRELATAVRALETGAGHLPVFKHILANVKPNQKITAAIAADLLKQFKS